MARSDYMSTDEEGKRTQFDNFATEIPAFATALGLDPADVSAQSLDAAWFSYVFACARIAKDFSVQWTTYKKIMLDGDGTATPPPTIIFPPTPITDVEPGIEERFREIVRRVKASANYDDAIGEALGVIGPEQIAPDPVTNAPTISLRNLSEGQIEVVWNKGMMEAIEIQKDSGSGWELLAFDTHPNYIDTTPFPTPPATWKYRAVYRAGSQRTGQWSPVVDITVGA